MTITLYTMSNAIFASRKFNNTTPRRVYTNWINKQETKYGACLKRVYT